MNILRMMVGGIVLIAAAFVWADAKPAKKVDAKAVEVLWKQVICQGRSAIDKSSPTYTVQLVGRLTTRRASGLVAHTPHAEVLVATDANGKSLLVKPEAGAKKPALFFQGARFRGAIETTRCYATIEPLIARPKKIAKVSGRIHYLIPVETKTHDLEPSAAEELAEIATGLSARVKTMVRKANSVQVVFHYDRGLKNRKPLRFVPPIFNSAALVDGDRKEFVMSGIGKGKWEFLRGDITINFQFPRDGEIKKIRLTYITKTETKSIPFEFTDIVVP